MTNIIYFNFRLYDELNIKNIFFSIFNSNKLPFLDKYILNIIMSFLLNYDNIIKKTIKINYLIGDNINIYYDYKSITLSYYDFIFQLSRIIWSNFITNKPYLLPTNYKDIHIFVNNEINNIINYPIHFDMMIKYKILLLKLFIELANDLYSNKIYNCLSPILYYDLEKKYFYWFNNLQY